MTELTAEQIAAIRARQNDPCSCRHPQATEDVDALLSHADALAAKVAHAEARWQKDAMQIDTDFDDLREERDEARAKIATLEALCDSLKAKVARLEGERDAARAVLRDVQWSGEAATCPSCQWDTGDHWIYCELADAIDPDRHDKEDSAHVAHD